jgi:hypothetical protein
MLGIAATREIGILGTARQNAMGAHMHVVPAVLVVEQLAISRHEDRDRIRQQQHSRGDAAGDPIGMRETHASVLQIDGVHQMVKSDMGIAAAETREKRSHEPGESVERITAKSAEEQVEPDHVGLKPVECPEKAKSGRRIVKRPAAQHGETV